MEEYVNKLAELQAEIKAHEIRADEETIWIDERIVKAEEEVKALWKERAEARLPYLEAAEELKTTIGDLYAAIIDEWTGEHKTMVFDAGTLKFRTSQSLKIRDATLTLTGLLDHTSIKDVATNYIKGFNLTAVKKYMGVLDLPMGAAEIDHKTTVKLDVVK